MMSPALNWFASPLVSMITLLPLFETSNVAGHQRASREVQRHVLGLDERDEDALAAANVA